MRPSLEEDEIGFSAVTTTYIKVVKEGLNEVPVVYVTEIQAFQALEITGEDTREGHTNYVDLHTGYDFTDWLDGAFDVSYRKEDAPGGFGDRSNFDYALRDADVAAEAGGAGAERHAGEFGNRAFHGHMNFSNRSFDALQTGHLPGGSLRAAR